METLEYLKKYAKNLDEFQVFNFMTLQKIPEWCEIEKAVEYLLLKNIEIDESKLLNQYVNLKEFLSSQMNDSNWKNLQAHKKWCQYFLKTNIPDAFSELLKIVQYVFSIFAHNANVERIFSLITSQWTKERNKLCVETINGILQTTYNFDYDCNVFYDYISKNPDLLAQIGANDKYN